MAVAVCAAIFSYSMNKLFMKITGNITIVLFSPIFEEAAKTLLAFMTGVNLLKVHVYFGLIEGVYDFFANEKKTYLPAISSVFSHWVCGWVTMRILMEYDILYALISGSVIHLVLNNIAATLKLKT